MRVIVVLVAVLLWSAVSKAAPTPTDDADADSSVPPDATPADAAPAVGYRKETLDTVTKDSSVENIQSKTKSKEKVKVKHLKGGLTMTVITDSSNTKTKKEALTDQFSQTNHTLEQGGLRDSTSLTQEHQHRLKEVDSLRKKDREVIITDKYGNVVSDTKKEKVKEKTKKKEKDKQSKKLVHTVLPADSSEASPLCYDFDDV